jgi:2-phosphosulfolactate phosphatase
MNSIEVCLSPALFEYKTTNENYIVAIVDVLRATTAFCAAFDSGVEAVIPVSGLDELEEYKNMGYLTAAERNGEKVDFADFGNSPTVFLQNSLAGKELAYSTTNGTQAIEMAKSSGSIVIAAFSNLSVVCAWISEQHKNAVILCSGWKNTFSLEDTLCAGAIIEKLLESGKFISVDDASHAAQTLWMDAKENLIEAVEKGSHFQRLKNIGLDEDLRYCFLLDTSHAVPAWDGFKLVRTA